MPSPASVVQSMTAQVGSALRRALRRGLQRWGPALFGALLLSACTKDADQELDLHFKDPTKRYGIALDDGPESAVEKVKPGSQHVLVRISGAMVDTIKIIIYGDDGRP